MDYTTIIGTIIAGLVGTNAWSFYRLKYSTRTKVLMNKDVQLQQWRNDLRERTKHLENQVQELLTVNAQLLAKVDVLQEELQELKEKCSKYAELD